MIPFIDFNESKRMRNIFYGGDAGVKFAIFHDNDIWMLKMPKSTRDYKTRQLSYTTSPLSEYLGSKIYEILGIPVHETLLGQYEGKVVVACKDFTYENGQKIARLFTFNEIKNAYMPSDLASTSGTGSETLLEEVLDTISGQENLQEVGNASEWFWDMFIVDAFIGNNDRNNGNWGILIDENTGTQKLAPVYDNGNSFFNKRGMMQMERRMNDINLIREDAYRVPVCAFKFLDDKNESHKINPFEFIKSRVNSDCNLALLRFAERVNLQKIDDLIDSIPEKYGNLSVMPLEQKEFYKSILHIRLNEVLYPVAKEIQKNQLDKENTLSLDNAVKNARTASKQLSKDAVLNHDELDR
ncbi:TPA: hypothetical protein TU158_001824 [Streptococcus equi subsp. zooepidemicus]|nr:hypothetical protein [Streptococcus equi subsp. zooepidemicus]HEL1130551.1 hypothetical protein [Streptococcus equi subsp. zooepidemicus]